MEQYSLIRELGRGNFGITFLGIDKNTGQNVAIKAINIQESSKRGADLTAIHDEIDTLTYLASDHKEGSKYLAKYYTSFTSHLDGVQTIFIISEYIEGTDLYGFISKYPPAKIPVDLLWPVFTQLLLGLKYIHSNDYAHRDIKPENILITKTGEIKYIDFGLACLRKCRRDLCKNTCKSRGGTYLYSPPEFYKGDYIITLDTEKAHDIWSLGVVMHELTFGKYKFPFNVTTSSKYQIEQNIAKAPIFMYEYQDDDGRTLSYLKEILINDLRKRPTVGQALYLLLDRIFAKFF
jgi:maternal embryonic leucine zipper kinase